MLLGTEVLNFRPCQRPDCLVRNQNDASLCMFKSQRHPFSIFFIINICITMSNGKTQIISCIQLYVLIFMKFIFTM